MRPRPWDSARGTSETARILRWVGDLAETYARARYDRRTIALVSRGAACLEDLARGVAAAQLSSPTMLEALEAVISMAAIANEAAGPVAREGVLIAETLLVRKGMLDPARDTSNIHAMNAEKMEPSCQPKADVFESVLLEVVNDEPTPGDT